MRAGVIGLGVGERHLAAYAALPVCRVVAVCDTDPTRRALAQSRYPGIDVLADPFELLARPDVDVVSIASLDDAHCAQISTDNEVFSCVYAGQPGARSMDALEQIEELWRGGS